MIIYSALRKYLDQKPATIGAVIIYALMLAAIIISFSQIGADLRYANV